MDNGAWSQCEVVEECPWYSCRLWNLLVLVFSWAMIDHKSTIINHGFQKRRICVGRDLTNVSTNVRTNLKTPLRFQCPKNPITVWHNVCVTVWNRMTTYLNQEMRFAMLGTVLLVLLILMVIGAMPTWPHSREWGYYPSGGIGLILLILLILVLIGRVPIGL